MNFEKRSAIKEAVIPIIFLAAIVLVAWLCAKYNIQ